MLLAVDVGNTHIVVGVFDGEQLVADFRAHTDSRATGDELGLLLTDLLKREGLQPESIDGVIVSNGVPALARPLSELSQRYFSREAVFVGPGIRTGIRIHYDDPRQVGGDRIANAIAARHVYGAPAIVVDFGTATTFDCVDSAGDYLGGAIAPGIQVSLDALVEHAARLTNVELTAPATVIGHTTVSSVQSGLMYGYVGLVEGLVARIKHEIGGAPKVIATGGLAEAISELTGVIDVVDQRVTLTGLRLIHEQNL
ncbi:MAG TPA: type III pantothenate kinase [Candidatus Dormibacteraeota bacterium]|nr:type III pantothenate kinase [Candidatus Dormibacteraeota bacterium]